MRNLVKLMVLGLFPGVLLLFLPGYSNTGGVSKAIAAYNILLPAERETDQKDQYVNPVGDTVFVADQYAASSG